MEKCSLILLLILGLGCSESDRVVLWDYGNKTELKEYSIIDTDSVILSKYFLTKRKLRQIEAYKCFIIKADGYYDEVLNMYSYSKNNFDTIQFQHRLINKHIPPRPEIRIEDYKFEEKSNRSFLKRDSNIKELIDCLSYIKEKPEVDSAFLQMEVGINGKILDHKIFSTVENFKNRKSLDASEGKECIKNLGEIIYGKTARSVPRITQVTLLI